MAKDRIKTRSRGGKILTGIIAFLLGFIIALVAEVGAIIGAGWFFLNKPIDSIFAIFDLKNDDGDGNQNACFRGKYRRTYAQGNEARIVDRIPLRKRNKLRGNGFRSAFSLRKGGIQRVQRGAPCAGEVSGTLLLCRPFRRRYVRICGCGKESGGAS